jgi:hypothetical protein
MNLTPTQLTQLLLVVMGMEHNTTLKIDSKGYWAMTALAQEAEAASYIVEYFARKAVTAEQAA